MQAARRWGVIWPAALAALCALSGMALGLLLGLLAAWRRASEPAAPAVAVDRHVAEQPPPWPLAPRPR